MSDTFLGLDRSGNDNNFTVTNMTLAADQMLDTPTNNFPTWCPIALATNYTYSEGNLKASNVSGWSSVLSSVNFPATGKWYVELLDVGDIEDGVDAAGFGVIKRTNHPLVAGHQMLMIGSHYNDTTWRSYNYNDGTDTATESGVFSPNGGDILQIAFDSDNSKVWIGEDNSWIGFSGTTATVGGGNPSAGTDGTPLTSSPEEYCVEFISSHDDSGGNTTAVHQIINFGQDSSFAGEETAQGNQDGNGIGDFYYTPPTGFLALCTANLPEPTITPSEHFNTIVYDDGAGAKTGVGFQPDLVWLKSRGSAYEHELTDAVRGVTKAISADSSNAETTDSTGLTAFGADGFTVGADTNYADTTGDGMVAWNWKAGGSGSANAVGDIASTVSVNTDAGFSIVSYTGSGTGGDTVGHGLSKAPEFVVVKKRNSAGTSWVVLSMYAAASSPEDYYGKLEQTDNFTDHATIEFWGNTAPTASVFSIGDHTWNNASSDTYIAYCFHSVDGYSKMGSYTGNASTDGAFIYTGFRPALVIIKPSSRGGHWMMANSESNPFNIVDKVIFANGSAAAEYTDPAADCKKDFLSNGFKLRTADDNTNDNETYIYLAFAETPFKYSNAK